MDEFSKFLQEIFNNLETSDLTKSYIISIFKKYKTAELDFSKNSITLLYHEAKTSHDFVKYQNLGDFVFFTSTFAPAYLHRNASEDYYQTIAKSSYYSCYNLINRKWELFKELSDNYEDLESKTKYLLRNQLTRVVVSS